MTALVASLAAGAMSASGAIIVAGIDNWDSTTAPTVPVTAAGITATTTASASTGNWAITDSGGDPGRGSSDDTTWGSFDGNGAPASAVTNVGVANFTVTNGRPSAEVTLTITNGGTIDLDLANFHMDVLAFRPNAPRAYELSVLSGDITNGVVFTSVDDAITHLGGGLSGHAQHDEIDLSLAGLADNTLAAGESAVIQIAFSSGTGSGGGHHLFLDNVAVSGDFVTIPEPSSTLLLGLGALALGFRRRK